MLRYPRTQHLEGSGLSKGDEDLDVVSFEEILGKHLVVECKYDGANAGVSISENGELLLQCRGHYLVGNDWPEFDQLKVWARTWESQLFDLLSERYLLYFEWTFAFHSVYYDLLPHYVMEFDIYDKQEDVFLDTPRRHEFLSRSKILIPSVKVLKSGIFKSKDEILSLIGVSEFISENAPLDIEQAMKDKKFSEEERTALMKLNKDRLMEGLYIKWEEDGIVKGRYKYVRPGFVQTILDCGQHWSKRQTIPNKLRPGATMFNVT